MPRQAHKGNAKSIRSYWLEARVDSEQKALFERAAALQGCSLSTFLIMSAREAAIRTIRDHEMIQLADSGKKMFIDALLKPPKPTKKMRQAVANYKKEMGL